MRLRHADGRVEERTPGGFWWGPHTNPEFALELKSVDGSDDLLVKRSEIATLEPIGGFHEDVHLIKELQKRVSEASKIAATGQAPLRYVLDDHKVLRIDFRIEESPCCPELAGTALGDDADDRGRDSHQ